MYRHEEVDVDRAVAVGAELVATSGEGVVDEADMGATARDILLSLPGITVHNFRAVMARVDSVSELTNLSKEEMIDLLGIANATKLYEFIHQTL